MSNKKISKNNKKVKAQEQEANPSQKLEFDGIVGDFFKQAKQNKKTQVELSPEQLKSAQQLASITGQELEQIITEVQQNLPTLEQNVEQTSNNSNLQETEQNQGYEKRRRFRKPKIDDHLLALVAQREYELEQEQAARNADGYAPVYFQELLLEPQLLKNLHEQNYYRATDIQAKVIPCALNGQDVFGIAQTGTGKTLAFLVPAIQFLYDYNSRTTKDNQECSVLIIAPTRDLVLQIYYEAQYLLDRTPFNVSYLLGKGAGDDYTPSEAADKFANNHIIVSTPGRLANELNQGNVFAGSVKLLILDEVDRTLEIGLGEDLKVIDQHTKNRRNNLLFSATPDAKAVQFFNNVAVNNPEIIEASHSRSEKRKLVQYYYHADSFEHKMALLAQIIADQKLDRTIVFVNKKENIAPVYKYLIKHPAKLKVTRIDGDKDKEQRQRAIGLFDEGKVQIIVTTDLLSRGIDIEKVKAVFNFDMPYSAETFVHRVGRTGRIGEKGLAISLIEAHDYVHLGKVMRYMREIISARIHPGLEPQTSVHPNALMPKQVKKDKDSKKSKASKKIAKKDDTKKKVKVRHHEKANKGYPKKFLAKKQNELN